MFALRSSRSTPIHSKDGTLLTDKQQILHRWAEHFQTVLNCPSSVSQGALDDIDQLPTLDPCHLHPVSPRSQKPNVRCLQAMLLARVAYSQKCSDKVVWSLQENSFLCWRRSGGKKQCLGDFATPTLYKRKGDRESCYNHRGITQLATAWQILSDSCWTDWPNIGFIKFF